MDAVQKANAGHPGTAMALAPLAYTLFKRFLRANPAGHRAGPTATASCSARATPACCSTRCCTSPATTSRLEDLEQFRQWGSRTPGHPERGHTPGIEVTTGPLGQGVRQRRRHGDGRALPGRPLQPPGPRDRRPPRLRDLLRRRHDGGHQPGSGLDRRPLRARQADRLLRRQPHHDRRHHRRSPSTARTTPARLPPTAGTSSGWPTPRTSTRSQAAIAAGARRKPSAPRSSRSARTSPTRRPNAVDTAKAHGAPLGEEEVRATKEVMGFDPDRDFWVDDARLRAHVAAGARAPPPQAAVAGALRCSLARGTTPRWPRTGTARGRASCATAGARRCRVRGRRADRHALGRPEGDGRVRASTRRR